MTTDITIRTNGQYIAKGTLTINSPGQAARQESISVGPSEPNGGAVEKTYYVAHGSSATLDLVEKSVEEWAREDSNGSAGTTEGEQAAAQGDIG